MTKIHEEMTYWNQARDKRVRIPDRPPAPVVSIVIPAYKADHYLPDALQSVRNQTFKDWELIVVEDGTRDNTEKLVRDFAETVLPRRVTYLRHDKNQGLPATRNAAIQAAKGEFIALLDHDDIWNDNHLEK